MRKREEQWRMDELMETADAGRVLDLTPAAVRLLAKQGKLRPAVLTRRGQRLYWRADVEALARARRKRSAAVA
jgi:DNA-binding transcriptional MerR regulator